jgi:hypothetical protein
VTLWVNPATGALVIWGMDDLGYSDVEPPGFLVSYPAGDLGGVFPGVFVE